MTFILQNKSTNIKNYSTVQEDTFLGIETNAFLELRDRLYLLVVKYFDILK